MRRKPYYYKKSRRPYSRNNKPSWKLIFSTILAIVISIPIAICMLKVALVLIGTFLGILIAIGSILFIGYLIFKFLLKK